MTLRDMPGKERSRNHSRNANGNSPPPAATNLETELKLAGPADALETLWKSELAPQARTASHHLISTYFDTSDFRLRRRGFTLRVRQDGADFVQTVKAEGSVIRRGESSTPMALSHKLRS